MSLPVTIEVAEELEKNHDFSLGHAGQNPISYYHVFPNARWAMAVTGVLQTLYADCGYGKSSAHSFPLPPNKTVRFALLSYLVTYDMNRLMRLTEQWKQLCLALIGEGK